jgi:internalin A
MATTRPRRRGLAISLRLFLGLVLVAGTWMAWKANRTRAQRRAIRAIEQAGGEVLYDYQYRDGKAVRDGKPQGPGWLRKWLGDGFFHDVACVHFYRAEPSVNAAMSGVEQFDRLQALAFFDTRLSDTGLSHVQDLRSLRVLRLFLTDVTNGGLRYLRSLENLEVLEVLPTDAASDRVYFNEDGLANLEGLKRLRKLGLCGTGVTDRGVAHLKGLARLEELDLSLTNVTDEGLENLTGLTNLRKLGLRGCRLADRGMAALSKLTELRELDVRLEYPPATPLLTAEGVMHLTKLRKLEVLSPPLDVPLDDLLALPNLKRVDLRSHPLSEEELDRLRAAHPSLIILTRH